MRVQARWQSHTIIRKRNSSTSPPPMQFLLTASTEGHSAGSVASDVRGSIDSASSSPSNGRSSSLNRGVGLLTWRELEARSTGSQCGGHATGWLTSTSLLATLGLVVFGTKATPKAAAKLMSTSARKLEAASLEMGKLESIDFWICGGRRLVLKKTKDGLQAAAVRGRSSFLIYGCEPVRMWHGGRVRRNGAHPNPPLPQRRA
eukprot:scaffold81209_cov42-Phaeocystis_antarctica.AAC.1